MSGFIHGKLDIKLLVLYLAANLAGPVDFATLTDLAMCDDGVDYFQFAESVSELVATGHLHQEEDCYTVTDKGLRNNASAESSLSPVIRKRCDRRLAPLNEALRRSAQIKASVQPHSTGNSCTVTLTMEDGEGPLFSLSMLAPTVPLGQSIADAFREHPERIFNGILHVLLHQEEEGTQAE
jgi:hypothetical protein